MWKAFKFIMGFKNYFKDGKAYIWKEIFAMIRRK